jgi:hypothetical protein
MLLMTEEYPFPALIANHFFTFLNLEGENDNPIMIKGEKEFNKLQKYVSEITGVPVERIDAANIFWAEQFWGE